VKAEETLKSNFRNKIKLKSWNFKL